MTKHMVKSPARLFARFNPDEACRTFGYLLSEKRAARSMAASRVRSRDGLTGAQFGRARQAQSTEEVSAARTARAGAVARPISARTPLVVLFR
jgi:hypothetical protein